MSAFEIPVGKLMVQCLTGLVAVYIGFLAVDMAGAVAIVKHTGYWLLMATVLLLLWNGFVAIRESQDKILKVEWRQTLWPVVFILVSSLILIVLQEPGYKIVMDEPVLTATALQMHHEKEAMTAARAFDVGGAYHMLGGYVGKRPFFFPFAVSVLHDLTGYRALQGVVLNHLLAPVFLGLLFLAGKFLAGLRGGYLAVLLFLTVPLLSMNVNGAGFELLNLVMILGLCLGGILYLRKPSDSRYNVFILLGVLLAQTRYESATYIASVAIIALVGWIIQKRVQLTWTTIVVPLLVINIPLQQIIFDAYPEMWQLKEGAAAPFTFEMIPQNLGHAFTFFFMLDEHQPASALLSGLFCLCLPILIWVGLKRGFSGITDRIEGWSIIAVAGVLVANFWLLMSYHWGQIDDIVATRIVLPFILFQVLAVVYAVHVLGKSQRAYWCVTVIVVAYFISVTRPLCARTDFLLRLVEQQDVEWVTDKIKEFEGQSVLFVTNKHMAVIAEQESCLPQIFAKQSKRQIDFHHRLGTFPEVIFLYKLIEKPEGSGNWQPDTPIEKDFNLEVLEEHKLAETNYVRVARLKSVVFREDDPPPLDFETFSKIIDPAERLQLFAKTLP